jgi:Skp family chaperone for outer membrane proteins
MNKQKPLIITLDTPKAGTMRLITLLLLLVISYSSHAEVYKCSTPSKQIIYQSTPCSPNTADQNIVDIPKLDERQQQEAENRLKATEAERQALDKAAQDKRDAAAAKWQAEAPQREAAAARQEAAAARREAAQQAPYQMIIPYPSYPYNYNYNYGQKPSYHPYSPNSPSFSPSSPYTPSFSPYPSFAPHPSPYIPPYMPFPTTR